MNYCKFDLAWVGYCGKKACEGGFCPEHTGKVCVSCRGPATHECNHVGQLVCGYPLCDDCEHGVGREHRAKAKKGG